MVPYASSTVNNYFNVENSYPLNNQQFISQPSYFDHFQKCLQQYSIDLYRSQSLPYLWPCIIQEKQQQKDGNIPYGTTQSKLFINY